ncbi:putative lipoprotein [Teredinibacter turnerae T7901]|uniref:Lipoprotein n=1 Tax=Teredinibacter turnerae (strain ATCC 39867 / T7901) TaxID=377629 RepID=C5BK71_TERTT|nr:putative lipoprotein [Teredinibacter turnerae T7901]
MAKRAIKKYLSLFLGIVLLIFGVLSCGRVHKILRTQT